MKRVLSLADDTGVRIVKLVENSAPNPNRPTASKRFENLARDVDRRTAACFAALENLAFKARKTTEEIRLAARPRRVAK